MSRMRVFSRRIPLVALGVAFSVLIAVASVCNASGRGGFHGGVRVYGGFYYPFYYPWWGAYYPYPYPYPYRQGYDYASRWAAVKTDVEPDEAALYLDGKLIGTADDFDGYPDRLYLGRGQYRLEFRLDGYETYTTEIDAAPGRSFRIDHHLKRIKGAKHYGTYEPARPEGGVVRFWAKRGAGVEPGSPDAYAQPRRGYREEDPRGREAIEDQNQTPELSETRLSFEIEPAEAAVYIDGRFAGGARDLNAMREGLSVEPGEHHITVTCPGYRESTLEVTASERKSARVRLHLSR